MTRIGTNIGALRAQRSLLQSNEGLQKSLQRLSTGFRINNGADDPAGLVISERLRTQIKSLDQAVDNSARAKNFVSTAEAALTEVNFLLTSIQDLVVESANDGALSDEEVEANQFQLDAAVETINRIANTTSFAGKHFLDGSSGYVVSGLNLGATGVPITELEIRGAALTNGVSNIAVTVSVTQQASRAILSTTSTVGLSGASILIRGNRGSELLVFNQSTAQSAIVAAVNTATNNTGVTGSSNGTNLVFLSEFFGDDQFVQVQDVRTEITNSAFMGNLINYDEGRDVTASVNGIAAATDGNTITINSFELDAKITLSATFYAQNEGGTGTASHTFRITGGGLTFQLGGGTNTNEQEFIGIQRMTSENLGGTAGFLKDVVTGGSADLATNPETAQEILEQAIDDVTNVRARLGAFEAFTIDTNINSLRIATEELSEAESRIRDTDFAAETAEFTKQQILVQAGTAVLAQANLLPQTVLSLLA